MGVSYRAASRLALPPYTSIRLYLEKYDVPVKLDNFKMLAQYSSETTYIIRVTVLFLIKVSDK